MVNQKGEFPLDDKISARVSGKTKRLLNKLKQRGHSYTDVLDYAALKLSDEPLLLEWEIDELTLLIEEYNQMVQELTVKKQAKLNRLKMIAPKLIDDETLNGMLEDYAKEYADALFKEYGVDVLDMLNNSSFRSSIRGEGKDCGYDPLRFAEVVRSELHVKCRTHLSDI